MDTPKSDEITLREIMDTTGLSRSAIYKRIAKGELTPLPAPIGYKKRPETKFSRAEYEASLKR